MPGTGSEQASESREQVILLCREPATSPLFGRVAREAGELAACGFDVHLYCTEPVVLPALSVHAIPVESTGVSLVDHAYDFAHRTFAAVQREHGSRLATIPLVAYEWGAIPALLELNGESGRPCLLSLESLERQRSDDLGRTLSTQIDAIEQEGLRHASRILVKSGETAARAAEAAPGCGERLVQARGIFPVEEYEPKLDPAEVKARHAVGPIDPLILFIGDLDERHGPDLALKAMPAILRNSDHARLVVVGDGALLWPLKVQSRYMLLDHATRIVGHLGGREVRDLIAAADIVVVPSRERTEDWQILSAWAARRPVVATHEVADGLCLHEQDAVVIYSNPGSCVWGIERVLFDAELGQRIGERGRSRLEETHGWPAVAEQIAALLHRPA